MQTETGAREGVLTAHQIDNLSIIGRSSLELLRILPGVVAPDQNQLESVSFFGGANNTQALHASTASARSSNTVSLDGSNLVEAACNCGLMTGVNNDMVQEVKVQSSNFGAEFGSGAVSVSAVTKSGSSKFSGSLYDYVRDWRFAANDRSNSIAGIEKPKSRFIYPGGNIGGPIPLPFSGYNAKRDKLFFWFGLEVQRQDVDSGSRLSTTFSQAARTGDLSEFLANRGQNLNHPAVVLIPASFPGAGTPAPGNDLAPYVTPLGRAMANLYPLPNYTDPDNRYNYVYSALEPTNRIELRTAVRLEHQRRHQGVRPDRARSGRHRGASRPLGEQRVRAGVADAGHRHQSRALIRRHHRPGAEPDDDQRGPGARSPDRRSTRPTRTRRDFGSTR